jgi:glyoxylase-like metal-dependent hydrolase (beta-lactamase superfamily II)
MMFRTFASILCIGAALTCRPSASAAQSVLHVPPAARSFHIGAMNVSVLRDGSIAVPNDGSVFGLGAGPAKVSQVLRAAGKPTEETDLDIAVLLVRNGGRAALIDAGYGLKGKSVLKQSLALVHVSPLQITDILITHAHPDHVGGLVDATGRSAFPRATIHLSAKEWRFMQRQPETRAIARAVRAQVRTFDPGHEVLRGIRSIPLYGHTPGHVMYELVSGGERLLDVGDAVHSLVISLARPEWTVAWDWDKRLGERVRVRELTRLAASHERIFAGHFPFPGLGHVASNGHRFRFIPGVPAPRSR